jgi:hypothetical protein
LIVLTHILSIPLHWRINVQDKSVDRSGKDNSRTPKRLAPMLFICLFYAPYPLDGDTGKTSVFLGNDENVGNPEL